MDGKKVRVAVCEAPAGMMPASGEWLRLAQQASHAGADLLLLNEMPFGPWISSGEAPDSAAVESSIRVHEEGLARLQDLGVPVVLGTRPLLQGGKLVNEAFVWREPEGIRGVHTKQYFPDEEGYYEARWFRPGAPHFLAARTGLFDVGFLICTEVMFNEHARRYGRDGAHVIAVPRATGGGSLERWLAAVRMAAIVSGCYVVSSNRNGTDPNGQRFGGAGWIVDPAGDLVARTSPSTPVACYTLDLDCVRQAQREYPCYVPERTS